jgi:hypothetical protein
VFRSLSVSPAVMSGWVMVSDVPESVISRHETAAAVIFRQAECVLSSTRFCGLGHFQLGNISRGICMGSLL